MADHRRAVRHRKLHDARHVFHVIFRDNGTPTCRDEITYLIAKLNGWRTLRGRHG